MKRFPPLTEALCHPAPTGSCAPHLRVAFVVSELQSPLGAHSSQIFAHKWTKEYSDLASK